MLVADIPYWSCYFSMFLCFVWWCVNIMSMSSPWLPSQEEYEKFLAFFAEAENGSDVVDVVDVPLFDDDFLGE